MIPIRYIFVALLLVSPLSAQRYQLKDGKILKHPEVIVKGEFLVRSLSGGVGEQKTPLANVVRLDWPQPAEIAEARVLLAAGSAAEAETKITPIYKQFAPFSTLPGSWWSDAALIRARALVSLNNNAAAEAAAQEIIATSTVEDTKQSARMLIVKLLVGLDKKEEAETMITEIMSNVFSDSIAAEAAVLRGAMAFSQKAFEKSVELYLQVPAFYSDEKELMPAALLGGARALRGYGDVKRAERIYLELIEGYPDSGEASSARTELTELSAH